MRDESQYSNRDISEGNRSGMEAVVADHITVFLFKLDLNTKKKLGDIMVKRNHMVFTDTMRELIDEEHNRSIGPEDVVGKGTEGYGPTCNL